MAFMAKSLSSGLARQNRPEARTALEIHELLRSSVGHLRQIVSGLLPVPVLDGGLSAGLEHLAESTRIRFAVKCRLHGDRVDGTTDSPLTVNLYLIAQEAVSNAVRHGGAGTIDIRLARGNGRIALQVEDDGCGFDPAAPASGMGLRIMRYRADLLDGSLTIAPRAEGGMVVSGVFPDSLEEKHENSA